MSREYGFGHVFYFFLVILGRTSNINSKSGCETLVAVEDICINISAETIYFAARHPPDLILRSGTKLKLLSKYCSLRVQLTKCDLMGSPQGCLAVALFHYLV